MAEHEALHAAQTPADLRGSAGGLQLQRCNGHGAQEHDPVTRVDVLGDQPQTTVTAPDAGTPAQPGTAAGGPGTAPATPTQFQLLDLSDVQWRPVTNPEAVLVLYGPDGAYVLPARGRVYEPVPRGPPVAPSWASATSPAR